MSKNLKEGLVGVIVLLVIIGAYLYPKAPQPIAGASPSGSTFGTQHQAAIIFTPSSTTATSTSILNTDSSDRLITQTQVGCEGLTSAFTSVASLQLKSATTSTANPAVVSNTNLVESVVIATSTPSFILASSTPAAGGTVPLGAIWAPGSYLTFFLNATSTGVCTVGVQYLGT